MRRTGCDGGGKRAGGGRWTCLEGEEGCSPFLFVFQKLGTPFRVVDHLIAPVRLANKLTIDPLANYVPARETRIAVDRFLRSLPPALSRPFLCPDAGNQVDQFLRTSRRTGISPRRILGAAQLGSRGIIFISAHSRAPWPANRETLDDAGTSIFWRTVAASRARPGEN